MIGIGGDIITLFNIIIMVVLSKQYFYHKLAIGFFDAMPLTDNKWQNLLIRYGYKFHVWMFYIVTCLLVANFLALITGLVAYFIYPVHQLDIIVFGRLGDRYAMMLGYISITILGRTIFSKADF
jgi:hypothetical protein